MQRLKQNPNFRQEYALPTRRQGSIVHVVEVESATPDANGLCAGHVIVYTISGDILAGSGEDCLILDVNA